jgi:hypothetical protein
MISTTTRGNRMGDLIRYLFGPGHHDEHTDQRIVAASDPTWIGTHTPDRATLKQLIAELDDSHVRYGERTSPGHVWHLIIAIPAGDGALTDAQWRHTAEQFAARLGLDDGHVAWAAVHHGRSTGGNDHIHLAVNLIRDDGTVVNLWRDAYARRDVARQLETEFGLTTTAAAGAGTGEALSRYESETLRANSAVVLPRHRLAALVRATAATVETELEFVRALRSHGIVLRPRVDKADTTRVVGYSVALPGRLTGGSLVWFGGGTLSKDLRLPALRASWPDSAPVTAKQWRSARAGPHRAARPAEIAAAHRALDEIGATLGWAPVLTGADRARLAHDGAGLLAAAAATTDDPFLQRSLLSAARAVDRALTDPAPTPPPPLTLTAGLQTVRACRAVLAASRPGSHDHRLDGLLMQITELTTQISDLLLAHAQTTQARAAADATRRAAELVAATARPPGWNLATTAAPPRPTDMSPAPAAASTVEPAPQPGLDPTTDAEQLQLFGPGD